MHLDERQTRLLADVMADLSAATTSDGLRAVLGERLMALLGADHFASYVWEPSDQRFGQRVVVNMTAANLDAYEQHFQFHDPITHTLRLSARATFIEEALPREQLYRTEFYRDFLARDGLHHGLNFFAWVDVDNVGDLRIWRGPDRPDFDEDDRVLLDILGSGFTAALRRLRPAPCRPFVFGTPPLTSRERDIAVSVAQGLSDRDICRALGLSFGTVRTHLGHVFDKVGVRSRTQLARLVLEQNTELTRH